MEEEYFEDELDIYGVREDTIETKIPEKTQKLFKLLQEKRNEKMKKMENEQLLLHKKKTKKIKMYEEGALRDEKSQLEIEGLILRIKEQVKNIKEREIDILEHIADTKNIPFDRPDIGVFDKDLRKRQKRLETLKTERKQLNKMNKSPESVRIRNREITEEMSKLDTRSFSQVHCMKEIAEKDKKKTILTKVLENISVLSGRPIYMKNISFQQTIVKKLNQFANNECLRSYKYYILFITFDSNNINELRSFNLGTSTSTCKDITEFANTKGGCVFTVGIELSKDAIMNDINAQMEEIKSSMEFRKKGGFKKRENRRERVHDEEEKLKRGFDDLDNMSDFSEDEVECFQPIIIYFQSPYYMNDSDLELIIKFLEDSYDDLNFGIKFIFIFKVLNGSQFQSPLPNCHVTCTPYDGSKNMFHEFIYGILTSLENCVISPRIVNFLLLEYKNHRPSINQTNKKVYMYCALHILRNYENFLMFYEGVENKDKNGKTFIKKRSRYWAALQFFSCLFKDDFGTTDFDYYQFLKFLVDMNSKASQMEVLENVFQRFQANSQTLDNFNQVVKALTGIKDEDDDKKNMTEADVSEYGKRFGRKLSKFMDSWEDRFELQKSSILKKLSGETSIRDSKDRFQIIAGSRLHSKEKTISKEFKDKYLKKEKNKFYFNKICNMFLELFERDVKGFYKFVEEKYPSIFIDDFYLYEDKINPDVTGNYMVSLLKKHKNDSIFAFSVKKLYENVCLKNLRIDCAELFDEFKADLSLMKISDEIKQQLFYYSIHSLKYCGLLTDGYKKGLYLQKNFFAKSVWREERRDERRNWNGAMEEEEFGNFTKKKVI